MTHRLDWRLVTFYQGLQTALIPFASRYCDLDQGAVWLRDIADLLGLPGDLPLSSAQVSDWLQGYLSSLRRPDVESPLLSDFALHVKTVS